MLRAPIRHLSEVFRKINTTPEDAVHLVSSFLHDCAPDAGQWHVSAFTQSRFSSTDTSRWQFVT